MDKALGTWGPGDLGTIITPLPKYWAGIMQLIDRMQLIDKMNLLWSWRAPMPKWQYQAWPIFPEILLGHYLAPWQLGKSMPGAELTQYGSMAYRFPIVKCFTRLQVQVDASAGTQGYLAEWGIY